ncbi:TipAS antibiotic-recognition domain-containing protein [Nonomuraea sp. NPDC049646]|uniref:TipAS antibiotic-recognition domain-containing protein n=1 Tax=unclassified Nonomuraea TaxID=2593643 RepID=UPI0037B3E6C0
MSRQPDPTTEEHAEPLGAPVHDEYAAEAEERWGDTQAWAESARRTSTYTKEDWQRHEAEAAALSARLADAMHAGVPADGDLAMDLAEEHRAHLSRWFYDCTYDLHRGLAELYVSDPRFTAAFDRTSPGLAAYLRSAILANATRQS